MLVAQDPNRAEQLHRELVQLASPGREIGPVAHLPAAHISPYVEISLDTRRMQDMLGTCTRLVAGEDIRILVLPSSHLATRLPPPDKLIEATRAVQTGVAYDREELVKYLSSAGYVRVSSVYETGTFALRGSLVDVFSPGHALPLRIDFFGDDVESIAHFAPTTQLTVQRVESALLGPATEVLDLEGIAGRARPRLLDLADDLNYPSARLAEILDGLRDGELPAGAHAFLPLLTELTGDIFDYLAPSQWCLVFDDLAAVTATLDNSLKNEQARYLSYRDLGRLALPPEQLFLTEQERSAKLASYTRLNVAALDTDANLRFTIETRMSVGTAVTGESKLAEFEKRARELVPMGVHVAVTARDERDCSRIAHLITGNGLSARVCDRQFSLPFAPEERDFSGVLVFPSDLQAGVDSPELGLYVTTAQELFDKKGGRRESTEDTAAQREKLLELEEGDFVVHREYGIGRFSGVVRKVMGSGEYSCLQVDYAGGDVLYVPVHNAGAVQRYIGSGKASPKLDKLGSASWEKRVAKARSATKKLAFSLLELYARRQAARGHMFSAGDDYFAEFEARFPFDETPDQATAVEDVLTDMEKPQPMDRLICGDVGFGKTEVAVRAAFKAILDGMQVAVLVPTTILAEQHRLTFAKRLEHYPVTVDSLSRFKNRGQQTALLKKLEEGKVDIVIATHRLLSSDIKFSNLGLLIVDEEHRFGVGHKEKLKALRSKVDVLSMTATPIPRTLHMAMTGIRDLSIIKTPPPGRLDIRTNLIRYDPGVVADAIRFELQRGGQVFFLHNRVEDILTVAEQLETLVPEARILVAHGQMKETLLERRMLEFMRHEGDVLLCTTIVESGLDIPTVNTLLVNNAHMFGLAQLYQIRGRIGRSSVQAFAYFIVPPTPVMSTDARARLATLAKFTQVGSGFQVASIDLELRGAGDLLGADQSGYVAAVGFDMYIHLLQEEVDNLKESREGPAEVNCQVEVAVTAFLPEEYIPDRHQRLVFYRMIASCESVDALEALRAEMRDRFGPHPIPLKQLLAVAELKLRGRRLGLTRIEAGRGRVKVNLEMCPDTVLDSVLGLVKEQPVPIKVTPDHKMVADFSETDGSGPIAACRQLLDLLERE